MKAEIRAVPPPPSQSEVVITMSPEDAALLRRDLRSVIDAAPEQRYGLNRLSNALMVLDLPE